MGRKPKPVPAKTCLACGKMLVRKRSKTGTLEDRTSFLRRKYCDQACMATAFTGVVKNPTVKNSYRQSGRQKKPACETCGSTRVLHVHHIDENPLNNDPLNLQTLCASCHKRWHLAHGMNSKKAASCSICGEPARKLGLCSKHYQRFRRHGDPRLVKRGNESRVVWYREAADGSLSILSPSESPTA